MTTVAVMQPYFMPYAGYFRLFAAADVFVLFDCVQFPRRGWVHRFPGLDAARRRGSALLDLVMSTDSNRIADYLRGQLKELTSMLGLSRPVVRSSELGIDPQLHGQARVIEIARALGARRYVNSPGGRALYDAAAFAEQGILLQFLAPFAGPTDSILTLLLAEPAAAVAAMIRRETILCH